MNKLGKPNLQDDDFYIPQNKEERKLLLKQYISAKLIDDWLKMPKQQATMERRFLRKLVDSL
jgi:hypothetical protein